MIKKLQIRFIGVAMLSVLVVLAVILGTINVINYRKIIRDADNTLSILEDNDGMFPMERDIPDRRGEHPMSPELPFESRYFSVIMSEDGEIVSTEMGKIAAIDTGTARKYAKEVLESSKEKGFLYDYRYTKVEKDGDVQIIFLDCGRNLATFQAFLITSVLTSVAGMLAVLVLVILLSKRILAPVSESYDKQKRFITDAGHEIKTPLTIIDADTEVLEMECGENEWLQDIQKQTARLKELTNNLIYLSRMEESTEKVTMIDFPVSDLVEETAASFQALAVTQRKTFDCEVEPMLTLHGDEQSIQRLLTILLDNALKYSEPEGHIELKLKKSSKNICLTVYNTATYVSRENISHIFERFYRLDESRNSATGGYGIGLSIASAIVRLHKGKIYADTKDEKSICITVII